MINSILGSKLSQSQFFDADGNRIPVTNILAGPCVVIRQKTTEVDGYNSVVIGFGMRRAKTLNKAEIGNFTKAGIKEKLPRFLNEVKITDSDSDKEKYIPGANITVTEVLKEGDVVEITGTAKGSGFAGVVKRHHFKGGPRTHGQSDRERAPGSIGQTTTPGRVYKGKRMAGRMGQNQVTVKNLKVVKIDPEQNIVTIKGLVAGKTNSLLLIKKVIK